MKRFIAKFHDGFFINVAADRIEFMDHGILAWDGENMMAYVDLDDVAFAQLIEKPCGKIEEKK